MNRLRADCDGFKVEAIEIFVSKQNQKKVGRGRIHSFLKETISMQKNLFCYWIYDEAAKWAVAATTELALALGSWCIHETLSKEASEWIRDLEIKSN